MLIIGERLNSSGKNIRKIMEARNDAEMLREIMLQSAHGADYIDINTARLDNEADELVRIGRLVYENTNCGISLDSPDPDVVLYAAKKLGGRLVINSVTLDDKYNDLVKNAARLGCLVIALPIDSGAIPDTPERRTCAALTLKEKLIRAGISEENIYIDIIVTSLVTNDLAAMDALRTLSNIKEASHNTKCICGLSNISFGLPARNILNAAFLDLLTQSGLDAAILDPTQSSEEISDAALLALRGEDELCIEYIRYFREKIR